MSKRNKFIPAEFIEAVMLLIREQRVIITHDSAALYGVTTKALNQEIKRNEKKFPDDFRSRAFIHRLGKRFVETCTSLAVELAMLYDYTLSCALVVEYTAHPALSGFRL